MIYNYMSTSGPTSFFQTFEEINETVLVEEILATSSNKETFIQQTNVSSAASCFLPSSTAVSSFTVQKVIKISAI